MNGHREKRFLNQVILEGIVASEVRVFEVEESKHAEFYFLSTFSRKDTEDKIKVIFWNAKNYLRNLEKGNHLLIIGELQKDKYISKKGDKVNTFKISANYIKDLNEPYFSELPI